MNAINYEILQDASECFAELDETICSIASESKEIPTGMAPMFYPEFINNGRKILYVGINPSLTDDMLSKFKSVHGDDRTLRLSHFSGLKGAELDESISRLIDFQAALKGRNDRLDGVARIPYFSSIDELHREAFGDSDVGWEHFDLFSYRATLQKHVVRAFQVRRRNQMKKVDRYFKSSMIRFSKIVEEGGFLGIVILNAAVSRYVIDPKIIDLDRLTNHTKASVIRSRQLGGAFPMKPQERTDLIEQIILNFHRYLS
jgi:hypothetical protein